MLRCGATRKGPHAKAIRKLTQYLAPPPVVLFVEEVPPPVGGGGQAPHLTVQPAGALAIIASIPSLNPGAAQQSLG